MKSYVFDFILEESQLHHFKLYRDGTPICIQFSIDNVKDSFCTIPQPSAQKNQWHFCFRAVLPSIKNAFLYSFIYFQIPPSPTSHMRIPPQKIAFSKIPLETFPSGNARKFKIPLLDATSQTQEQVASLLIYGVLSPYFLAASSNPTPQHYSTPNFSSQYQPINQWNPNSFTENPNHIYRNLNQNQLNSNQNQNSQNIDNMNSQQNSSAFQFPHYPPK